VTAPFFTISLQGQSKTTAAATTTNAVKHTKKQETKKSIDQAKIYECY
jgi:hypothetical protein